MKISVQSVSDIGQAIRATRISQNLDQLTAAQLSNTGQSFLSHLENGKETAQIGKVLQVLTSLGIAVELTLPPHLETLQPIPHNNTNQRESLLLLNTVQNAESAKQSIELLQKLGKIKRVRRG